MPSLPLLFFPRPSRVARRSLGSARPDTPRRPTAVEQAARIHRFLQNIEQAFQSRRARLQHDPAGAEIEQVLVLETVGRVDNFINAVRRVPGLEWMGEVNVDDLVPDEDFYWDDAPNKLLSGRLYLVMSNQQGVHELVRLWRSYNDNPEHPAFRHGLTRWRDVFHLLKDIRPWGPEDRLHETGLFEVWQERVQAGDEIVNVEIELWPRSDTQRRSASENQVIQLIRRSQGEVLGKACVPQIAYHAILARLPIANVGSIVESRNAQLVHCDDVMFLRPSGQAFIGMPPIEESSAGDAKELPQPTGSPTLALLDGFPLENHEYLSGHIIVDDPDGWAPDCPANKRHHGTAMASLILHGELDGDNPVLSRPIYIRPILKPVNLPHSNVEMIPDDVLAIDLVNKSVRRIFESTSEYQAAAPTVKIINISVCDRRHVYNRYPTAWARLLDYLSWEYKVLFIVSAGNYFEDLTLQIGRSELDVVSRDAPALENEVLKSLIDLAPYRPLPAPADGINVLTVAASHSDDSTLGHPAGRLNPLHSGGLPSPINAQGLGFRKSVKPDILYPGGRQTYRVKLGNMHSKGVLTVSQAASAPGQTVATPSHLGNRATTYTRGTSNSAALTTRNAALLYELLEELRNEPGGEMLQDNCFASLLKAMLVHSASWGTGASKLLDLLRDKPSRVQKAALTRLLGYGVSRPERVFECTEQRVTLLACGEIRDGEAEVVRLPLPPSLSGKRIRRKCIITLGWLSPITPRNQTYRLGALWFTPYGPDQGREDFERLLGAYSSDVHWQTARNGTVQHQVYEGAGATAFVDGEYLSIQVNCRSESAGLTEAIPYGLVVTLEVSESTGLELYTEVRERIRPVQPVKLATAE